MTVKLNKLDGTNASGKNPTELIILLAQQAARTQAQTVAALTDSSGGDATPTANAVQNVSAFVEEANVSTSLAQKASAETIIGTLRDAVTELAAKANAIATKVGVPAVTDNSGGASADGTIAAISVAVTAATTGARATETNAVRIALNDAFLELALQTNRVATACGVDKLNIGYSATHNNVINVIPTAAGTAADPGISKAALNAALTVWRDNVAYIAAKLNECRAASGLEVVVY